MYQLGTKWKLWELQNVFQTEVGAITLRGYINESPVSLPADFYTFEKRLSVERIASTYCPTRRDVYFEIKRGIRQKSPNKTWGQTAGSLIEEYCRGILEHFHDVALKPAGLDYQIVQELVDNYSKTFWTKHENKFRDLHRKAVNSEEEPEKLFFLLQQTAKYELILLGADYELCQNSGKKFVPLIDSIPIRFDAETVTIAPEQHLGLGKTTTPDFIILKPVPVMGDLKSGKSLKFFHLNTIAGYALAYESQYNVDVNFGVIYFFETHSKQMNFAQSYVFVIDDLLRKQFLTTRDKLYKLLQNDEDPPLVDETDYETYCQFCKYHVKCYPER